MASIYRRGSIWWGRATRAGKEYRKSLGTANKAAAEKRLRGWLNEIDKLHWGEKPLRPWQEVCKRFILEHFPTVKPASGKRYAVSLDNLSRIMDGKSIQDVRTALLADFVKMRREDGASGSTIRRDLTCLSLVMSYCEEWEWIEDGSNIVPAFMRRMRRRGLKEGAPRTRYLSEEEEAALLAELSGKALVAVALAIDTGLRDQEEMSLQWSQIDIPGRVIKTTTKTKSGKARLVPLADRSAQMLAQMPRHFMSPFVFCHADGTRYVRFIKAFNTAVRRAGLSDLQWHDLRRTAGCRWLQRDGRSLEEVSWFLGHSSVVVTERSYAFLDLEVSARKPAQGLRIAEV